jgi:hypothetical protein
MKIAIILVGHIRTWEKCKQSFIDTFNKYDPDIYLYTYNTPNYKSDTKLSEVDIREIFKDIRIHSLIIKDENEVFKEADEKYTKYYIENGNTKKERFAEFCCQYINIKNCFEVVENSGINYDFVVKTRPDMLYYFDPSDIFIDGHKNSNNIYTSNQHNTCDFFAVSTFDKMKRYCNTIDILPKCYEWCYPHVEITPHMLLHYSLLGGYTNHLNVQKCS